MVSHVGQFVEDDVVADLGWGLNESPVEGDHATAGATTPPRMLIAHPYPGGGKLMEGRQFLCFFAKNFRCDLA